ncbi:TPA: hypothetical protein ACH3X2_002824 [Trebouxia sp. C0005]
MSTAQPYSSLVTVAGTSCRVWLGLTLTATQTALPGTSGFAEGSAISVDVLGLCMLTLFVSLLWAWAGGHSDGPTNQAVLQAQPAPQSETQPACKHGTKLPFWKWAAALLLTTVCAWLGSTSVYMQMVSPGTEPVSPQQASLKLLERTATAHTVPFYTKETAVSEPSSAEARPTMLHLVAAEWGTSVESLQVKALKSLMDGQVLELRKHVGCGVEAMSSGCVH